MARVIEITIGVLTDDGVRYQHTSKRTSAADGRAEGQLTATVSHVAIPFDGIAPIGCDLLIRNLATTATETIVIRMKTSETETVQLPAGGQCIVPLATGAVPTLARGPSATANVPYEYLILEG